MKPSFVSCSSSFSTMQLNTRLRVRTSLSSCDEIRTQSTLRSATKDLELLPSTFRIFSNDFIEQRVQARPILGAEASASRLRKLLRKRWVERSVVRRPLVWDQFFQYCSRPKARFIRIAQLFVSTPINVYF